MNPLRTTVVGSYPKVTDSGADNLPGVIDRWQKKLVPDEALEQELQKVIRRVVGEQDQAGLDLITDGQIRWEDLPHPIARSSRGIQRGSLRRFFDNNVYYRRLEVPALSEAEGDGGVGHQKSAAAEEFAFASPLTKRPLKVALPGPLTLLISTELKEGQTRQGTLSLYAELLEKEVRVLEAAGVTDIQLDEPAFAVGEPLLEQTVAAINKIFQGVKARRWVAVYFQDPVPLLPALGKLQTEVLHLDLVSAREKNPSLLNQAIDRLKEGAWKGELSLGLVDARNTRLESAQELAGQLAGFLKVIAPDRLWLSPNSGLEFLPHASALKKLSVLREAARRV